MTYADAAYVFCAQPNFDPMFGEQGSNGRPF